MGFDRTGESWWELMRARARTDELYIASEIAEEL